MEGGRGQTRHNVPKDDEVCGRERRRRKKKKKKKMMMMMKKIKKIKIKKRPKRTTTKI